MEKVLTLFLADLVDSTALNSRIGDAGMQALWDRHDRASRDLARRWRGREIDRSDGFLMVFDAVDDGAAFAIAYHRMLRTLPAGVQARAGLHVGPLHLRVPTPADRRLGAKPLEVLGLAKATTARLMALAGAGQTLASAEAAKALGDPGPRRTCHGFWRFKGLDEPVEVHEIGDDDAPFVPPPDAEKAWQVTRQRGQWIATRDVPCRIPAERDSFHGRHRELRDIARRFERGARLVVAHGPGGVGKTRLALRYAWGWLGRYPGGVTFCDLSAATDHDGLVHAVGRGFDVAVDADPVAHLARSIAGHGRCLVVLDNFEQVTALAPETLGRWLDATREAHFLVTSREGLGLVGEERVAVPPLETADAVALFHDRARAACAGYDAGRFDGAAMRALVTLLDRLPLALELAAARASVLPPTVMVQRIEQRFQMLTSPGGRPRRQATLRAAIDWSWEGLSPGEQGALAQLSVFEDSFSLPAAEAVVRVTVTDGGITAPVVDLLQALVDKSLVGTAAGARFNLLTAIKAYAAERLAAPGDAAAESAPPGGALRRHRAYFAALDEAGATADRCVDAGNIVAACRRAAAAGDAAEAARLLMLAWAALRLTGPLRVAADLARSCLALPGQDAQARATASLVAGAAGHAMGTAQAALEARAHVRRGLAALPDDRPADLAARLHCLAGELASQNGEASDAAAHLQRGLALAQSGGEPTTRCHLLNALGALAADQGQLEEAQRHYRAALDMAEQAALPAWQGGLLGNLGWLYQTAGRPIDARDAFERARDLALASGDRRWEGNARCNLGLVLHELGQHAAAQTELEAALDLAKRVGHGVLACTVSCNLGLVREALGDLAGACRLHRSAVDAAGRLGDVQMLAQLHAYLGSALARDGQVEAARSTVDAGLALALPDHLAVRAVLQCARAEACRAGGRPDLAPAALAEARALQAALGLGPDSELGRWIGRATG